LLPVCLATMLPRGPTWLLFILCLTDLGLNSSVEFDDFGGSTTAIIPLLLLVAQFLVQIGSLLCMFLILSNTQLYQVGLLAVIKKHFGAVVYAHLSYLAITMTQGILRVSILRSTDGGALDLWKSSTYVTVSVSQKIIAAIYYCANLETVLKARHPKFYEIDSILSLAAGASAKD